MVQGLVVKYFEIKNTLEEWRKANYSLYQSSVRLSEKVKGLENVNALQRVEMQDYKLLSKVFGHKHIGAMLKQAKEIRRSKKRNTRFRNKENER